MKLIRTLAWASLGAVVACGGSQDTQTTSTASTFLAGGEDQAYEDGMRALRDGDLVRAETRFREALEVNSRYLAAHIALGDLLTDTGRADEAIASFRNAVRLRDASIHGHLGLAEALAATGSYTDAVASAEYAATLANDLGSRESESACYAVLGDVYVALGQVDDAISAFERALELSAGTTSARIGLASLYRAANRMPDAVRVLSRAAEYETDADTLLAVGQAFHRFGVYDRAIGALESAHEARPGHPDTLYYYASSAVRSGRFDLGIQLASELIALQPGRLEAYVVRGEANLGRGHVFNARQDAETVLQAEPNNVDALILAGDVAANDGDTAQAEQRYRRAISLAPGAVRPLDHLGRMYFSAHDYTAFAELISPEMERSDRPDGWLTMLVDALIRAGDEAAAVPYQSQLARQRDADHVLNHEVAARALRFPGSLPPEDVLHHARRAVEHVGGAPLPYRVTLIDAYLLNGMRSEARDVLDRAEALFPNATELANRRGRL